MRPSVAEKKFMILDRLLGGDRVVWQHRDPPATEAAWMMLPPQWRLPISTLRWMERHGLIAESIAPVKGSHPNRPEPADDTRRWYQSFQHVYAATAKGEQWFMDYTPQGEEK